MAVGADSGQRIADRGVRLAHFSDVHVTAPLCSWSLRDWFNKRMSAWVNLRVLGRGRHFRHTDKILAALRADLKRREIDRIVFSGDATAMGFTEEVRRAAELLGVGESAGLAVPGNHDYCTPAAMHSGDFERHFAPWLAGERMGNEVYPFAQRAGPYWLVGVNSSTANYLAWDARGRVGDAQLERLARLLDRLSPGPRILVTHYPVRLASGKPEHAYHGLRDLDELVSVARRGGVVLWLHGHRHDPYLHADGLPFPVICAGSATQHGRWSYSEYVLTGPRLSAVQRVYDEASEQFREGRTFELELPVSGSVLRTG
jgi:3',5'-cyclic AMP phosphodiesterase CpdA